jgi:hypothetical protein
MWRGTSSSSFLGNLPLAAWNRSHAPMIRRADELADPEAIQVLSVWIEGARLSRKLAEATQKKGSKKVCQEVRAYASHSPLGRQLRG